MISEKQKDWLIECNIQDIIELIANEDNVDFDIAMKKFYGSFIFDKLCDKNTGLYSQSPGYIYSIYKQKS